jgi:hypothetical protein
LFVRVVVFLTDGIISKKMSLLPIGKDSLKYGTSDAGKSIHFDDPNINKVSFFLSFSLFFLFFSLVLSFSFSVT